MSALECNRNGCERIMCDHYSTTYGYICWECLDELIKLGGSVSIDEFMQTEKQESLYSPHWEDYVTEEFGND